MTSSNCQKSDRKRSLPPLVIGSTACVKLKQELECRLNRSVVLLPRATSGLAALLQMIGQPGDTVLCPAVTCPAIPYAIEFAGCRPSFIDIAENHFGIDRDGSESAPDASCVAMVLVHTFGHIHPHVQAIRAWCNRYGVMLIEDICQMGLEPSFTAKGHVVLDSFGPTKLIDCGSGGVMGFEDEAMAAELQTRTRHLPPFRGRSDEYRAEYYSRWNDYEQGLVRRKKMKDLVEFSSGLFVHSRTINEEIARIALGKLANTERLISERRKKFMTYQEGLKDIGGKHPKMSDDDVPWRYTIQVHQRTVRDRLIESLRSASLDASRWYPSLALDWGDGELCPRSTMFEQNVLNLWLDESTSQQRILTTIRCVRETLEREGRKNDSFSE